MTFFAFVFSRLDNSASMCGWFGFKIYSNTTAMAFISCSMRMRTKQMLFKINTMFTQTHTYTQTNFNSLEISINLHYFAGTMVWLGLYTIDLSSTNFQHENRTAMQFHWVRNLFGSRLWKFTSQMPIVHVTHNIHPINSYCVLLRIISFRKLLSKMGVAYFILRTHRI